MTGVANAHLSGVPLLVLCGDVAWSSGGRRLLQNTGPEGLDVERFGARNGRGEITTKGCGQTNVNARHRAHHVTQRNHTPPAAIQLGHHRVSQNSLDNACTYTFYRDAINAFQRIYTRRRGDLHKVGERHHTLNKRDTQGDNHRKLANLGNHCASPLSRCMSAISGGI